MGIRGDNGTDGQKGEKVCPLPIAVNIQWSTCTNQGRRGDDAPMGEKGNKGEKGTKGKRGPIVSV